MQPPPYPEKHRGKPLRDKKDCREKKRTAEEKESLLAGRGGNSNGTRKAAGGEKRTAEKRESRQVGRQSRHGPRKECKKKREETRFPTVKKNKNGPFGDLSERESFIIFMPFYRNREAIKSEDAGWIPIFSVSKSWELHLIIVPKPSVMKLKPINCGVVTCCSMKHRLQVRPIF